MNAAGRITGDGRSPELGRYGFVWQQGTLGTGARTLEPFLTRLKIADSNTAARGINDAGFIVGFTNSGVGFVGNDASGFKRLIPPGGDAPGNSVLCSGINNFRQVVCEVSDVNGNTVGAFIGTPDGDDQQQDLAAVSEARSRHAPQSHRCRFNGIRKAINVSR